MIVSVNHEVSLHKRTITFKIIQVESPKTFEKINIGILIEQENKPPKVEFIENIDIYSSIFPIFTKKDLELAKKYILQKAKRKKIITQAMYITSYIHMTDNKLIYSEKSETEIVNELFEQYVTLRKANRYIKNFFQFTEYVEDRLYNHQIINKDIKVIPINQNHQENNIINLFDTIKRLRLSK